MATMTRTDSSNTATYVITDNAGSTLTVTVTIDAVLGNTCAFTNSGGVHADGLAMLWTILPALTTGIVPVSQTPQY